MLQSLYDKKYSESQSGWLAMTPSALGRGLWGLENVSVLARLQLPVALGFSDLTSQGLQGQRTHQSIQNDLCKYQLTL